MAIKVIVSEYSEEGKKFDDQNVIDENTDKKKPAKRYGFLILGNINYNATKQQIQNYFKGKQITVDTIEHVYDFQRKTKKTGIIALSVDDFDRAVVDLLKIPSPILSPGYNSTIRIIEKHSINET